MRVRLEDKGDERRVNSLPEAEAIKSALEQSRPERCRRLREQLVMPRKRLHAQPFAECPEVNLTSVVMNMDKS